MKIKAVNRMGDTTEFGSMLFDLKEDPGQEHPMENEKIRRNMCGYIRESMKENDAPAELYDRLGI